MNSGKRPVGASLMRAPASTLPVTRPTSARCVGGQRGDQLADAGQHLDVAVGHLAGQQLDVAVEAGRESRVDHLVGRAQPAGQLSDRLRLRLARHEAAGRVGIAGAPQVGQVAHDAGIGAAVEAVVAELALDAVHVVDGAPDGATAGAVGVDQRAVDVEEGETLHEASV